MLIEKRQIAIMVLPYIAVIFSIITPSFLRFKPSLSQDEQWLSRLSSEKFQIVQQQLQIVTNLNNQMKASDVFQRNFLPIPLSGVSTQESLKGQKVSIILITNSGRKMAIINNLVVNEGDIINNSKVEKIEKGRILIKDEKGEAWINIE